MTILLVMWLVAGQPPQAYEVRFGTPQACALAKAALEREADRLNREAPTQIGGQTFVPLPLRVSALCVAAG